MDEDAEGKQWQETVLSVVGGSSAEALKVKKVRKQVLLSLQRDETDKAAKKIFKRTVQHLEEEGVLQLDADGTVKLSKKRKHKAEKKSKKKKKKKHSEDRMTNDNDEVSGETNAADNADDKKPQHSSSEVEEINTKGKNKNAPCKGNPQGVTRLFLGNLPFAVDEASLEAFLPGLTHVKWITDKETGKFYGSAFVEMDTSANAASAVAKAGSQLMGRPIKVRCRRRADVLCFV